MGNSLGPGHVPVCLNMADNPGLSCNWDPERTRSSIFSPLRMVEDASDGGASGPTSDTPHRSYEELMAEIEQSEHWKTFISDFEEQRPILELGEDEAKDTTNDDLEELHNKILEKSVIQDENKSPEYKEAMNTNLHKLKEKTGYPYVLCKKALEHSNNDFEKAEKWLETESKEKGLEKLKKIENRRSPEGLVGVALDKHHAAMVEVNSETDFVSGNTKFHELVDIVAKTCLRHTKKTNPSPKTLSEVMMKEDEIGNLVAEDKQSLSDHLIKAVSVMGERLRIRRAALVSVEESAHLAVLAHSSAATDYKDHGRLATVLAYRAEDHSDNTLQLVKHVCQQIIGMNPKSVEPAEGADKDTALLTQKYLLEPTLTVAEVTARAGLKIEHFVRFERGEPTDTPDDLGTEPAKPIC